MDFDDLDDAIEQRVAEGGELPQELMPKAERVDKAKSLPKGIPLFERNEQFPITPEVAQVLVSKPIRLRAFLFYGPGDFAYNYLQIMAQSASKEMELIVYEWPGHGFRAGEAQCEDVEALVEDAYQGLLPSFDAIKAGGEVQGAPFTFIGHTVGAQIALELTKKLDHTLGLLPSAMIVLDRGAPDVSLLSEHGQELVKSKPEEVVRLFRNQLYNTLLELEDEGAKGLKAMCDDLQHYGASAVESGFYKLDCEVLVLRSKENAKIDELAKEGSKYQMLTVEIEGSSENLSLPVQLGVTSIRDVKEMLSSLYPVKQSDLKVLGENGEQPDSATVGSRVTIKGISSFANAHYVWPHPIAIIGTGYAGTKMAAHYAKSGNFNFMVFDRHKRCGGDAWIDTATNYSKIQTDFAAFNPWWGPDWVTNGDGGFGRKGYETWYKRQDLIDSISKMADEYGVTPYIRFETDVTGLDIIGGADNHERSYKLTVDSLNPDKKGFSCEASVVYHLPGSYSVNRIVNYPGEDVFGGQIGYGMGRDFNWEDGKMNKATVAILGNGAFAIENVRTCCEFGADKVHLVTRRKNLASPRVPCWFVHQGPVPTPGAMILKLFRPMYEVGKMGDPFDYWSVQSNSDQSFVTISQASRFGIGDVTFLCHAYGKLEYHLDTLKRLTKHTLHLESGKKLEKVTGLIKSLGLLGDIRVDKLHKLDHRVSNMINGDYRRIIQIDATGMHASNFTTFSLGIGTNGFVRQWHWVHDNPHKYLAVHEHLGFVPKHKASKTQPDQPVYVTNVQYELSANVMLFSLFPELQAAGDEEPLYKYCLMHHLHPVDQFLQEAKEDWDKYQKLFKEQGCTHEYIEYPYNRENLQPFFEEYSRMLVPIRMDGPTEADRQTVIATEKKNRVAMNRNNIKGLVKHSKLHAECKGDPYVSASAKSVHAELARITSSKAGSACDFDAEQYRAWSNWTLGNCSVVEVEAGSSELPVHQKTWEQVTGLLDKCKVPIRAD